MLSKAWSDAGLLAGVCNAVCEGRCVLASHHCERPCSVELYCPAACIAEAVVWQQNNAAKSQYAFWQPSCARRCMLFDARLHNCVSVVDLCIVLASGATPNYWWLTGGRCMRSCNTGTTAAQAAHTSRLLQSSLSVPVKGSSRAYPRVCQDRQTEARTNLLQPGM
jgi:hypothetical protein